MLFLVKRHADGYLSPRILEVRVRILRAKAEVRTDLDMMMQPCGTSRLSAANHCLICPSLQLQTNQQLPRQHQWALKLIQRDLLFIWRAPSEVLPDIGYLLQTPRRMYLTGHLNILLKNTQTKNEL